MTKKWAEHTWYIKRKQCVGWVHKMNACICISQEQLSMIGTLPFEEQSQVLNCKITESHLVAEDDSTT